MYGVTFYFENFDYWLGRSLLADLIIERFQLDPIYYNRPDDKATFDQFKEKYPNITRIKLYKIMNRKALEPIHTRNYVVTSCFKIDYSEYRASNK